jgi:hypothetical protein
MDIMDEPTQLSEARAVVAQVVNGQSVSPAAAENARYALLWMRDEAAEYGISSAEAVAALLRPVFQRKPTCDCPTCYSRRASESNGAVAGSASVTSNVVG